MIKLLFSRHEELENHLVCIAYHRVLHLVEFMQRRRISHNQFTYWNSRWTCKNERNLKSKKVMNVNMLPYAKRNCQRTIQKVGPHWPTPNKFRGAAHDRFTICAKTTFLRVYIDNLKGYDSQLIIIHSYLIDFKIFSEII